MNTWQTISDLFDAVFPLVMLFYGFVIGFEIASRKKKDSKPDSKKQEDERK